MKISIYELLGLVKDGKAPKKIKVTGTIYDFDEEYNFYFTKTKNGSVALGGKLNEINLIYNFNNENNVEILEEEKKIPEKLDKYADVGGSLACGWTFGEKKLKDKIDEIIDYLVYLKSKGE